MDIVYVTGNKGKIELAKMIYEDLDVNIVQENMETPEIQSMDCADVAKFSAEYAANLLGKPVMKNDSGLVIEALNGFPGALAKYAEDTITAEGYVRLMKGIQNRKCYWIEALAYCEPNHEPVCFVSYTYGSISDEVRGTRGYDYDKIFIPDGDTRTFAEMTEEEQLRCFDSKAYKDLYKYLLTH